MKSYLTLILIIWSEMFAVGLILSGIIIGTYGVVIYRKNWQDEQNYRPWKTICYVRNYKLTSFNCYDQCSCFEEEFIVEYEIFNKSKIISRIQSKTRTIPTRKFNGTCYYNGRYNLTLVKWNYEDKTIGLNLFNTGYGIVAFILPIMIIIFKFFYTHISASFMDNHLLKLNNSIDRI